MRAAVNNRALLAAAMAAVALAAPGFGRRTPRITPTLKEFRFKGGKRYRTNGKQERARRRRQIASGQLTVSNGLWR